MIKRKNCKGTGKAKGYGCGSMQLYRKYGLGRECGCYGEWLFSSEEGRKTIYKIRSRSKKRSNQENQYTKLRKEFLARKENKICPITKKPTTDIHHKKGRIGSLLLDTRYWIALSREGHQKVENNPKWAKENGYSLSRLEND